MKLRSFVKLIPFLNKYTFTIKNKINPKDIKKYRFYEKDIDSVPYVTCYYCFARISSHDVKEFAAPHGDGICPICLIDSLIKGDWSIESLIDIFEYWFNIFE